MQTRDQKLALAVYTRLYERLKGINEPTKLDNSGLNHYGAMAHKLPILIRTAGLAQALAFVEARGKDAHKELLKDLATIVGEPDLVQKSREVELGDYMRLTQHSMAALLWFKRYAQSVLGVEQGADTNTEGENK